MKYLNSHFKEVEKRLGFPDEAVKVFESVAMRIEKCPFFSKKFDALYNEYMRPQPHDFSEGMKKFGKLARFYGVNAHSLQLVFLIIASEELHRVYREKGLSEEMFWDTLKDLRYKYKECCNCQNAHGIFVGSWELGFYRLTRFALGRFQYDTDERFDIDEYTTKSGVTIKKGDKVLNFHIPSSGIPLSDENRLDSFKKAYDYFKDFRRDDGLMIFVCHSWLLYDGYKEFLPKKSNILKFLNDFEIIECHETEKFGDAWRIFDRYGYGAPEKWPADTSLRKAFKERVLSGKKTGAGYGLIVFDGEKVIK